MDHIKQQAKANTWGGVCTVSPTLAKFGGVLQLVQLWEIEFWGPPRSWAQKSRYFLGATRLGGEPPRLSWWYSISKFYSFFGGPPVDHEFDPLDLDL